VVKLFGSLNKLVSHGNTVVLIEHNLDIIKSSDYIIDIGPEGGDNGGKLWPKARRKKSRIIQKVGPENISKSFAKIIWILNILKKINYRISPECIFLFGEENFIYWQSHLFARPR